MVVISRTGHRLCATIDEQHSIGEVRQSIEISKAFDFGGTLLYQIMQMLFIATLLL